MEDTGKGLGTRCIVKVVAVEVYRTIVYIKTSQIGHIAAVNIYFNCVVKLYHIFESNNAVIDIN